MSAARPAPKANIKHLTQKAFESATKIKIDYKAIYPYQKRIKKCNVKKDIKNESIVAEPSEEFKDQFYYLLSAYYVWAEKNIFPSADDKQTQTISNYIIHFINKIFDKKYYQTFITQLTDYDFEQLKENFEIILHQLNNKAIPLEKRIKIFEDVINNLISCAAGMCTHVQQAAFKLNEVVSITNWLVLDREKFLNERVAAFEIARAQLWNQGNQAFDRQDSVHIYNVFSEEAKKNGWNPPRASQAEDKCVRNEMVNFLGEHLKERFESYYRPNNIIDNLLERFLLETKKIAKAEGVKEIDVKDEKQIHWQEYKNNYVEKVANLFSSLVCEEVSPADIFKFKEDGTAIRGDVPFIAEKIRKACQTKGMFEENIVIDNHLFFVNDFIPVIDDGKIINSEKIIASLMDGFARFTPYGFSLGERCKILGMAINRIPESLYSDYLKQIFKNENLNSITNAFNLMPMFKDKKLLYPFVLESHDVGMILNNMDRKKWKIVYKGLYPYICWWPYTNTACIIPKLNMCLHIEPTDWKLFNDIVSPDRNFLFELHKVYVPNISKVIQQFIIDAGYDKNAKDSSQKTVFDYLVERNVKTSSSTPIPSLFLIPEESWFNNDNKKDQKNLPIEITNWKKIEAGNLIYCMMDVINDLNIEFLDAYLKAITPFTFNRCASSLRNYFCKMNGVLCFLQKVTNPEKWKIFFEHLDGLPVKDICPRNHTTIKDLLQDIEKIGAHKFKKLNAYLVPGTPLTHICAINDDIKSLEMFLNLGVDVNLQDGEGRTLLHFAAHNRSEDIVNLLLNKSGINLHLTDKFGISAYLDIVKTKAWLNKHLQLFVKELSDNGNVYQQSSIWNKLPQEMLPFVIALLNALPLESYKQLFSKLPLHIVRFIVDDAINANIIIPELNDLNRRKALYKLCFTPDQTIENLGITEKGLTKKSELNSKLNFILDLADDLDYILSTSINILPIKTIPDFFDQMDAKFGKKCLFDFNCFSKMMSKISCPEKYNLVIKEYLSLDKCYHINFTENFILKLDAETQPECFNKIKMDFFFKTKVFEIVRDNNLPLLKKFVSCGVDVKYRDGRFFSLLHLAAENDRRSMIEYLVLDVKADINEVTRTGNTALHIAAKYKMTELTELLLCLGADPKLKNNSDYSAEDIMIQNQLLVSHLYIPPMAWLQNDDKNQDEPDAVIRWRECELYKKIALLAKIFNFLSVDKGLLFIYKVARISISKFSAAEKKRCFDAISPEKRPFYESFFLEAGIKLFDKKYYDHKHTKSAPKSDVNEEIKQMIEAVSKGNEDKVISLLMSRDTHTEFYFTEAFLLAAQNGNVRILSLFLECKAIASHDIETALLLLPPKLSDSLVAIEMRIITEARRKFRG